VSGYRKGQITLKHLERKNIFAILQTHFQRERFGDSHLPKELLLLLGVFICTLAIYLQGLDYLEFFRHTEADRTLISWEMKDTGNYLVPHLLGSPILTKPPFFYWMQAMIFEIFGDTGIWYARLPSVLFASMLVALQFWFFRRAGASSSLSLFGALILGTSGLFSILATVAEIDMTYGFLSAAALAFGYFSAVERSLKYTLLAYIAAAVAFLTKGPPTIAFYASTQVIFFVIQLFQMEGLTLGMLRHELWEFTRRNALGMSAFMFVLLLWLVPLASHSGWAELYDQFRIEVIDRAVAPSSKAFPWHFYLGSLMSGLLPWSIPLVLGLIAPLVLRNRISYSELSLAPHFRSFFVYNLVAITEAVIILTFAHGKSNRYLFPCYSSAAAIAACACLFILAAFGKDLILKALLFFFAFLLIPVAIGGLLISPAGVLPSIQIGVCAVVCFCLAILAWCLSRRDIRAIAVSGMLFILSIRFAYLLIFVPYRNATKSVLPIVASISEQIPKSGPIYTIEMFDRWVVYYLRRNGKEIYRITPAMAKESEGRGDYLYLLLNTTEETWRIELMRRLDPDLVILSTFSTPEAPLTLVKTKRLALANLHPLERFPTEPSQPFTLEVIYPSRMRIPDGYRG